MRLLLLSAVALTLAACGPSQPAPSGSSAAPAPQVSNEEMQTRVAALAAPYNAASYEAGRRVFAHCRSCHTIDAAGGNRVGPNLHGVFGREAGSMAGFNYSQALQDANFTWDADHLDHWLSNPQTALPGNRMAFAGVHDETQRRDLIAYLMVESAK
jgi:cytochrome c